MKKITLKKQTDRFSVFQFFMLTVAGIINSIGVVMFLSPMKLYDSGFSGTSMLLSQITPEMFSLSFFLLVLNIPFFLYGFKKQGVHFTVCSIYTVFIYSLSSYLITYVFPVDVLSASPFAGNDLFLCAVFGGIISGIGSGLTIRFGGAIDGVEVMAVIFAKQIGITVGTFVMVYNVLLYILVGTIMHSWILPLYSIITYYAGLKTIDFIVEGFDKAKAATIITTRANSVCTALSEEFGKGLTIYSAHGFYSSEKKSVIYFVVNRFQIAKMKRLVHENDPAAFISISEVSDVFGSKKH